MGAPDAESSARTVTCSLFGASGVGSSRRVDVRSSFAASDADPGPGTGASMSNSLMILVAGPYRSGTDGDPARIQANVDAMTATALELHRRGHLPVMGEWFALPLIEAAEAAGDDGAYEAIFLPIAEQVLARCDACLRIGGASEGADRMVATARRLGKTVFTSIAEVPRP
jgi:hypothetical protein